jgi:hypothetical protein
MKKSILIFLIIILCGPSVNADPIDTLLAKKVAKNFLSLNSSSKKPILTLAHTEKAPNGDALYFVYNVDGGNGFVAVSADNAALPILGYSLSGHFSSDNLSPEFSYWMSGYREQIIFIQKNKIKTNQEIRKKWESYKSESVKNLRVNQQVIVSPLLKTKWDQDDPFNAMCPSYLGIRSLTGCTATTMAQIMKYWKYPTHGTDAVSYVHEFYGEQKADFANTKYNWELMPELVTSPNSEIAKLMYHCGVSVKMGYGDPVGLNISGKSGSGAPVLKAEAQDPNYCAETAYQKYFNYSSSIKGIVRNEAPFDDDLVWIETLKKELDNKRPIQYVGGDGKTYAHTWVCDGYDSNDFFHMNWGWSGESEIANTPTGYWNLELLNPKGKDGNEFTFTENQKALIGIKPNYADLIVQDEKIPSSITPGTFINISCKVKNQSTVAAASSYTAIWLSKDQTFDGAPTDINLNVDMEVPALAAGATSNTLSGQFTIPKGTAPGIWYIMFGADALGQVDEGTGENNNQVFIPIDIPSTNISMLASGTYVTCSANFFDGGGLDGNYLPNQQVITTLKPPNASDKLSVTFSSFETDNDTLFVYNGNSTSAPLIGKLAGIKGYGTITSSAPDGSLTFKFVSDGTQYYSYPYLSGWAATIQCNITPTDITMLASGTFTTCSGNFYDGGGPEGNYMGNQDVVTTLKPPNAASKLSVTFSSFETDNDTLFVYNGNSTSAPLIGKLAGIKGYGTITSSAPDGSLTFKFVSDGTQYYSYPYLSGWAATIQCNIAPTDITMLASGTFTTCSGNFYDGGGPEGNYMGNQDVVTTLKPPNAASKLSVTFSSFETDNDTLFVYNGNSTSAPLIGKLSGIKGYGTITSSAPDGSLTFKFVSDGTQYYSYPYLSGWAATIQCNIAPTDITMLASGTFTTCSGNFYDGGGPEGNYMGNQDVVTTLKPPNAASKLSVTFSSFETDNDTLFVYNGNSTSAPLIGKLAGIKGYGTITSSAPDGSLTFKFVSDGTQYYSYPYLSGWAATIQCNIAPTDITMLASGTFTTCSGNFYDGGGPEGNYMGNQDVVTTLKPPNAASKLSVTFNSFQTWSGDTLYVYNGNSIKGLLIDKLSGQSGNRTMNSSAADGSLTFRFVSDKFINNSYERGWEATIACNPTPCISPTITPAGPISICTGNSVVLKTVSGTGYTYQWKKSGVNLPGATLSTYPVLTSGVYSVAISNGKGCTVVSQGTTVTVNAFPLAVITTAGPLTFYSGKSVLLKANTGVGYTYQWKKSGVNIAGATSANYTTIASGVFTVVVSNTAGCSSTSAAVTVVVNPLPVATITPVGSLSFCSGKSVILKAKTGTGYLYQWKRSGVSIPGAISADYLATVSGLYTVLVTNATGCALTSTGVNVVVNPLPNVTVTYSGALTFCSGKSVLLKAYAGTGYTYQWKKSGANIIGANSANYPATVSGSYTVVVTNAQGCSLTSAALAVVVNPLPIASITTVGSPTFCSGKSVLLRTYAGAGYTYQWKRNGAIIPNATTATLTATLPGVYTVIATNAQGCSVTSAPVTVVVNSLPISAVIVGGPLTFCAGKSVQLKAYAGAGYSYQWKKSGVNIQGATSASYLATASGVYTVVVTNASGCSITSTSTTVVVNPLPVATITPAGPITFTQGGNILLKAPISTGSSYQWKKNGVIIPGQTLATYTAITTGNYSVTITNANLCQITSNAVQVTVNPAPSNTALLKSIPSAESNPLDQGEFIKLYPSPLRQGEELNIEWKLNEVGSGVHVTVSDIAGKRIESRLLKLSDKKLNIIGANGTYIVEFRWGINKRKIFQVYRN